MKLYKKKNPPTRKAYTFGKPSVYRVGGRRWAKFELFGEGFTTIAENYEDEINITCLLFF